MWGAHFYDVSRLGFVVAPDVILSIVAFGTPDMAASSAFPIPSSFFLLLIISKTHISYLQLNNITSQSYLQHLITINGEIISANDDFMLDNKH